MISGCPYFRKERNMAITCEFARITPPDRQAYEEFTATHCCDADNYKKCEFYKLMDSYYGRKYPEWALHGGRP